MRPDQSPQPCGSPSYSLHWPSPASHSFPPHWPGLSRAAGVKGRRYMSAPSSTQGHPLPSPQVSLAMFPGSLPPSRVPLRPTGLPPMPRWGHQDPGVLAPRCGPSSEMGQGSPSPPVSPEPNHGPHWPHGQSTPRELSAWGRPSALWAIPSSPCVGAGQVHCGPFPRWGGARCIIRYSLLPSCGDEPGALWDIPLSLREGAGQVHCGISPSLLLCPGPPALPRRLLYLDIRVLSPTPLYNPC